MARKSSDSWRTAIVKLVAVIWEQGDISEMEVRHLSLIICSPFACHTHSFTLFMCADKVHNSTTLSVYVILQYL